jgi:hypothetical protein
MNAPGDHARAFDDGATDTPMTRLEYALLLAALGFWIIPVRPGKKTPAITMWQQRATRNEATLREWFQYNTYAVGIYAGKFGDDGALLIVDVDKKSAKDGDWTILDEGYDFPTTRTHKTPSGGRHLIYKVPAAVKQGVNVLGPGLDIRSKGGYIVAYEDGSTDYVLNAGPIADAPQWLIERCGKASEKVKSDKPAPDSTDAATRKRAVRFLETHPPAIEGQGGDLHTFKTAARLKDFGVDETTAFDLMAAHWNERCEPPWELEDLRVKVANAYEHGENEPGCADPRKEFEAVGDDNPKAKTEQTAEEKTEKPGAEEFTTVPPPYIRASSFDPTKIPVRDWILGKRLLRGHVSAVIGAGGVLKSMHCIQSAIAIVTKQEITGERVRVQGNTLVYDSEDDALEMERRVACACKAHGIEIRAVEGELFRWSGHDHPLIIAAKTKDVVTPNKPEIDKLIELIRAQGIVAVFLVPLRGIHRAPENDNADMEVVMSIARDIAREAKPPGN